MPVTINGSTGVVSPNGSAGTPAYQGADANTGVFYPAADTVAIATNGTEAMRVDSSQNVGIGTSSPRDVSGYVTLAMNDTTGGLLDFLAAGTRVATVSGNSSNLTLGTVTATPVVFNTNTNEAARIDSSGNLLVGTTVKDSSNSNSFTFQPADKYAVFNHANATASGTAYAFFSYNGGAIGSISQNGTTAVAYNTTSDYRLKTNVMPLAGALAKVQALNPCAFDWVDGRADDGFIAHELQAVLPNVVTGKKDAKDDEGRPQYQQVDYARIVPTLTAAIQELRGIVDSQAARIAALEGAAQ